MRSLGLDLGDKRIGVAVSDPGGTIAFSLSTIAGGDKDAAIKNVIRLAEQYEVERIVIGLPLCLDGKLGQQAEKVVAFADGLSLQAKQGNLNRVDIQMWDERLSTVAAERLLIEAEGGKNKTKFSTKKKIPNKKHNSPARNEIDAMAAAFILQGFLDNLREKKQCRGL
jgi:putative Holliday junction resolvase